MTKRNVCEIDQKVNGGQTLAARTALKKVAEYIVENFDPTFPKDEFVKWADSPSERPFRWNKTLYYWSN